MSDSAPRYQILRKLADGAMAEVLLAKDRVTQEQVVLKILRPELTSDPTAAGRFLDEAKVCQKLEHPHVVRHLGAGRFSDGRVYLVTEYLEGEDLGSHLKLKGPLQAVDLLKLALPLCQALEHVHRHGVVHRDLKPDNVFLVGGLARFNPKLLDFGLAHFQGPRSVRTATGVILATPEYTPPESIQGARADARSDLYSLGILLYEALVGSPPFVAANYGELLLKHLSEEPPPLPDAAAHLTPVLLRCLAKDPAARWASAAELGGALSEALTLSTARTFVSRTGVSKTTSPGEVAPLDETFGVYRAVKLLGEGAMGKVYLAKHSKLGRQVALKVMHPSHARNTELVERFRQEALAVNEINHEHIVEIFDLLDEETDSSGNPRVYCVMELLSGATLSEVILREQLSVRRIANLCRQIASALGAAHKVGVVHRDIKPDNVFITERSGIQDFVKVLDFGVAKLVVQLTDAPKVGTMQGAIIGTPAYMAPEQASGAGADFRADIYAMGVVLHELLTGKVPFEGAVFGQLVVQIMTQPPPPLPQATSAGEPIPEGLKNLVARCLAKRPEDRPASMEEVEQELSVILSSAAAGTATPSEAVVRREDGAARGARATPYHGPSSGTVNPESQAAAQEELPAGLRRPRAGLMVAAAAGVALLGVAGYLAFSGRPAPAQLQPVAPEVAEVPPPPQPPEPLPLPTAPLPPPEPTTVSVAAGSTPPGARVLGADGTLLGTTPATFTLPRSEKPLLLRFELPDHQPLERQIQPDNDLQLEVALLRQPVEAPRPTKKASPPPARRTSEDATVNPFE